mgnify:FL=1
MIQSINPQYYSQFKKGDTVTYKNKSYHVQEDRGNKCIIVKLSGKREKINLKTLFPIQPGTLQDYIFNGWFELYDESTFLQFANCELTNLLPVHHQLIDRKGS